MIARSSVLAPAVGQPVSHTSLPPQRLMLSATCTEVADGWPGRRSATHLHGCDLACAYCCTPELVRHRAPFVSADDLTAALQRKAHSLQGIVIGGGEPTSTSALRPLLEKLRALNLPVKLDTNGSSPELLRALIADELVSFVALDVKTLPRDYDRVTGGSRVWERVERSISAVIDGGVDHEFRTTCYPFAIRGTDLPELAAHLVGGKRLVLQQFRPRHTLDPAAATATPFSADELRRAALRCTVYLPTVVRGV